MRYQTNTTETLEEIANGLDNFSFNERFGRYSPMYMFATENLSGYFPYLDLKDKEVLTVCSSGDHIINSYMFGAKSVDCFDCNMLSGIIAELKIAATRNFSLREYHDFFLRYGQDGEISEKTLNLDQYKRIEEELSDVCREYFDFAYNLFNYSGKELRNSVFFNNRYDTNELKIMSNPYLWDESNFQEADCIESRFFLSDISGISNNCDKKYDVIMLSNISDYARMMFEGDSYLEKYCENVAVPLSGCLREGGKLVAAYVYADDGEDIRSQIDDKNLREEVFGAMDMRHYEFSFQSVIKGMRDTVIVLEKINRR